MNEKIEITPAPTDWACAKDREVKECAKSLGVKVSSFSDEDKAVLDEMVSEIHEFELTDCCYLTLAIRLLVVVRGGF
ncbi:MAG: hypothetical protein ABJQ41_07340 [Marinomonas sp.]